MGSVIIPAHNEAAVISRVLAPLAALVGEGVIEVVVACNGCTDGTAAVAGAFPGVRVLELSEPGKAQALNAADEITNGFPRIYLDADIEVTRSAIMAVLRELDHGPTLAARPPCVYDTEDSSALVRAYHRARRRLPASATALWGAGIYAVSEAGHARIGGFPDLRADDFYVDSVFAAGEVRIVESPPVVVRAPHTARSLLTVLGRTYAANSECERALTGHGSVARRTTGNLGVLVRSARSLPMLVDAVVYAGFAAGGRLRSRRRMPTWARDDSTRQERRT